MHNVTFSNRSILDEPIHTDENYFGQIRSVCKPCAVGKIEREGVCRSCSSGKYQDMEGGTDACKICPSGKYAKDVGASMCKSCTYFFEITDRRATKCMLNPVIYLVWGIAVAIFGLYLMLKAYYRLKESAMHSANKTFQDDLNALGGMDTLTNLRTSLSFGMDAPLIPNADRKLELDLVEVKKTSSENEKETIISSTPLEVIDAWEKLEYKIYGAKNSKELTRAFHAVLQFSKREGVEKFLKTKKQKMLSISITKKGGGVIRTTFDAHNNVPIQNRGVEDQIWDESVANIFRKVLQVLS